MAKVRSLPHPQTHPMARWELTAELLRLCVVSTRVVNAAAPLSLLLVGPPGDGKTAMLQRLEWCGFVRTLSDTTYLGLTRYLETVKEGRSSCLVIPDFATVVGRKSDVSRQCVATLAMMAAEGVGLVSVGKLDRDFGGAKSSVLTAITDREFVAHQGVINQNAFLSRTFVCDFRLELSELVALMNPKSGGLAPLRFGSVVKQGMPRRTVELPARYRSIAHDWWVELKDVRPDMWFAFRTAHQLKTLLLSAAYLAGRRRVTAADVATVERIMPVLHAQIRTTPSAANGS